jgi:putative Ca2+/H+ antiporter (TMEM165/GDT1 family)
MAAFLLALVAVFALSLGGRDQLLVARLAERLGGGAELLAIGALASAGSSLAMAAAGLAVAALLPEAAAQMLVAVALLVAAAELAWSRSAMLPSEPTHSLFATFVVLLARQLGDAARFCVFALAAGGSAWLAGLGGALGGTAALALGAGVGGDLAAWPLRAIRRSLALLMAFAAVWVALAARGIVG